MRFDFILLLGFTLPVLTAPTPRTSSNDQIRKWGTGKILGQVLGSSTISSTTPLGGLDGQNGARLFRRTYGDINRAIQAVERIRQSFLNNLLERAQQEPDPATREALIRDIQREINEPIGQEGVELDQLTPRQRALHQSIQKVLDEYRRKLMFDQEQQRRYSDCCALLNLRDNPNPIRDAACVDYAEQPELTQEDVINRVNREEGEARSDVQKAQDAQDAPEGQSNSFSIGQLSGAAGNSIEQAGAWLGSAALLSGLSGAGSALESRLSGE